jgi:PAS domain S-box-containing protein
MSPPDHRSLFEAAPSAMLVLAADAPRFTIVDANAAYLRATGTERAAIVGRGLFEAFPDNPGDPRADGAGNLRASLERVSATRRADAMAVQRHDIRRPDGAFEERHWRPLNTPVFGPDGAVTHIIHTVEDVTDGLAERRRPAEALRASEARFHDLADHAPVMMWLTDASGRCTYLNRRWHEFTGQAEEEALDLGWLGAVHPDDKARVEEAFMSANAARAPSRVEYRLRRSDGDHRWVIDAASRASTVRAGSSATSARSSTSTSAAGRRRRRAATARSSSSPPTSSAWPTSRARRSSPTRAPGAWSARPTALTGPRPPSSISSCPRTAPSSPPRSCRS